MKAFAESVGHMNINIPSLFGIKYDESNESLEAEKGEHDSNVINKASKPIGRSYH